MILVLEVEVDRPVGHLGLFGDVRDLGLMKALFGEDLRGGLYDPVVFLCILVFHLAVKGNVAGARTNPERADRLPGFKLNDGSFINMLAK